MILASYEADIVRRVVKGDSYKVEEWHVELVALVRRIDLYTVGVLFDDFEAIRVCKKEASPRDFRCCTSRAQST